MNHFAHAILLGSLFIVGALPANAATFTWVGGDGNWSTASAWDPAGPPGSGDDAIIGTNGANDIVTITLSAQARSVSLSDQSGAAIDARLELNDGIDFEFRGGGFVNDGQFSQNGATNSTIVKFTGSQSLSGYGVWQLSDSAFNVISGNGGRLTHGAGFGHEIRGAGSLLNNSMGLTNNSTIRQQGANALIVDPNATGVDNNGLMVAEGSGGLSLLNDRFTNDGGEIRAGDGSAVRVISATIDGGLVTSVGSGEIVSDGGQFDGVGLNGNLRQGDGDATNITGGLTNNVFGRWIVKPP